MCVREMETETQRFSCLAPEAYLPSLALNHCRTRVSCRVAETEPKLGVVQSSIIDYSLIALFLASGRMKLPDLVFELSAVGRSLAFLATIVPLVSFCFHTSYLELYFIFSLKT